MTGAKLREDIIQNSLSNWQSYFFDTPKGRERGVDEAIDKQISIFTDSFRRSRISSIDKFLYLRPEFREIGKTCIFLALINAERFSSLKSGSMSQVSQSDWLFWLYNKYISTTVDIDERISDLKQFDVRFITFNYDRSLEYFFLDALLNSISNGDNRNRFINEIEAIPFLNIRHVYGKLAELISRRDGHLVVPFGEIPKTPISPYLPNIQLIGERGLHDKQDVAELFAWAERIFFLGFGFDDQNLKTLNLEENIKKNNGHEVIATIRGFTRRDEAALKRTLMSFGLTENDLAFYDLEILPLLIAKF